MSEEKKFNNELNKEDNRPATNTNTDAFSNDTHPNMRRKNELPIQDTIPFNVVFILVLPVLAAIIGTLAGLKQNEIDQNPDKQKKKDKKKKKKDKKN
ncbi:hypothetical protein K0018_11555 [Staphylococcus massiliensis]|uniref:hypothetical protein n=1 Tax=Staphylococcus massiliensis TaxID=555791 RepID=UPI001EDEFE9D|nr:hypothetical protein [Staphylococcus massiliensis]MCG3413665.1 hypothetical protein [Staphylococcus massiliensis]